MTALADLLANLGFWNWVFAGLILMSLETLVPGRALPVVRTLGGGRRHRRVPGRSIGPRRSLQPAVAARAVRRDFGDDGLLGPRLVAHRAGRNRRAGPQRARRAVHGPHRRRRGRDRERPRQGARRRYAVAGAGCGRRQGRAASRSPASTAPCSSSSRPRPIAAFAGRQRRPRLHAGAQQIVHMDDADGLALVDHKQRRDARGVDQLERGGGQHAGRNRLRLSSS